MVSRLVIHPRIHNRHPELSSDDVKAAFNSIFCFICRTTGEYVGIGIDNKNRLVEMIFREYKGEIIVYHALTPPTKKVLKALNMVK